MPKLLLQSYLRSQEMVSPSAQTEMWSSAPVPPVPAAHICTQAERALSSLARSFTPLSPSFAWATAVAKLSCQLLSCPRINQVDDLKTGTRLDHFP